MNHPEELSKFLQFFHDQGIKHEKHEIGLAPKPKDAPNAHSYVTVGQTHFYFDKDGAFIGYDLDEMGLFFHRERGIIGSRK